MHKSLGRKVFLKASILGVSSESDEDRGWRGERVVWAKWAEGVVLEGSEWCPVEFKCWCFGLEGREQQD